MAVFMHMMGLHFPCFGVCPDAMAIFNDSVDAECLDGLAQDVRDRCNRYDNATLWQDSFLANTIELLRARKRPACLFYISDHGESQQAQSMRLVSEPSLYTLPCIIWLSPEYREKFPDAVKRIEDAASKPLQSDELIEGLLELGFIVMPGMDETRNFLSPAFKGRNPRISGNSRAFR